jgi:DNA-binding NarL/FixJ family response regulator
MSQPVLVRVHALDPISKSGILSQLRQCGDIHVTDAFEEATPGYGSAFAGAGRGLALGGMARGGAAGAGVAGSSAAGSGSPTVALAVTDSVDDDATRWLRALHRYDGLPVVLVVGQLDARALVTVVESGVRAVVRRCDATPQRLGQLVRAAAADRSELPPDLLRTLLDQVGQLSRSILEPRGLCLSGLTKRERDVLRLVADGLSTREVAGTLGYSERTIKAVIQEVTIRLHLRNRAHAVAYAARNGWI